MIRKLLKSHKVWKKKKKTTTRKQSKNDIFWLLPVISGICKSENTQSKSILAVILRGQPTLYNWRFTRYGKSSYFVIRRPPRLPPPKKNVFLGHFWLSERYTYLRTPMINQVLLSFWGLNQLSINSSLKCMEFGPKNGFCTPFSLITKSVLKIDLLRIPKQLLSKNLLFLGC